MASHSVNASIVECEDVLNKVQIKLARIKSLIEITTRNDNLLMEGLPPVTVYHLLEIINEEVMQSDDLVEKSVQTLIKKVRHSVEN